jgi:hypothetical protein
MMMNVEQSVESELTGETKSTRRKPTPVPLCPPQIPHDVTRARTRVAAVESRRLTAWAMARPVHRVSALTTCISVVCAAACVSSSGDEVGILVTEELAGIIAIFLPSSVAA